MMGGPEMTLTRLIFASFPADQAEQNWKEKCAPLMIRQEGCLSEQFLRCKDHPGEFVSYSEWDSEQAIDKNLASEDHREIKRHNTNITGATVVVKHYERV
jgi:heme-degrading monooxygenase HmoA